MFAQSRLAAVATALAVALPWPVAALADGEGDRPDSLITRSEGAIMGTRVTVSLWTDDEVRAAQASAAVFEEFRRIEALMTSWGDDSDVARINAAAGARPVRVDAEVLGLIAEAQEVARASGGAFDITVGAFRGLWKFDHDKDGTIPAAAEVEARRPLVRWQDVKVNRRRRTVKLRRAGMRVTLGGIAKGYAVDRAVAILRERGFVDFLLQAGGDLYVAGRRGDRRWRVGVRDPRGDSAASFAVTEVENQTFSTSGDYERSVIKDGVRYHHILDPATGRPATRSRSVTVMADDALTADAWSTALFVIGAERGLPMVEGMPGVEAVFVDADNQVKVSSGLFERLIVLRPPTPGL